MACLMTSPMRLQVDDEGKCSTASVVEALVCTPDSTALRLIWRTNCLNYSRLVTLNCLPPPERQYTPGAETDRTVVYRKGRILELGAKRGRVSQSAHHHPLNAPLDSRVRFARLYIALAVRQVASCFGYSRSGGSIDEKLPRGKKSRGAAATLTRQPHTRLITRLRLLFARATRESPS
eukprot:8991363-Pyramimonas_sp.AAC.4